MSPLFYEKKSMKTFVSVSEIHVNVMRQFIIININVDVDERKKIKLIFNLPGVSINIFQLVL